MHKYGPKSVQQKGENMEPEFETRYEQNVWKSFERFRAAVSRDYAADAQTIGLIAAALTNAAQLSRLETSLDNICDVMPKE